APFVNIRLAKGAAWPGGSAEGRGRARLPQGEWEAALGARAPPGETDEGRQGLAWPDDRASPSLPPAWTLPSPLPPRRGLPLRSLLLGASKAHCEADHSGGPCAPPANAAQRSRSSARR